MYGEELLVDVCTVSAFIGLVFVLLFYLPQSTPSPLKPVTARVSRGVDGENNLPHHLPPSTPNRAASTSKIKNPALGRVVGCGRLSDWSVVKVSSFTVANPMRHCENDAAMAFSRIAEHLFQHR